MTIGHAIILAAGQGSRLLPLTLATPKCLIEIGGQSILRHQVDALANAGIRSFTIVAGYRADQVENEAALLAAEGIHIETVFNPFWAVASSIGSVWVAQDLLRQPFLLLNGDTIFDDHLLCEALDRITPGLNLLVEPVLVPETDDMRVVAVDGRICQVGKGLPTETATFRSLGVVASTAPDGAQYLAALDRVPRSDTGAQRFHHAVIDDAARNGDVYATAVGDGLWQEIDRPEDMARWSGGHVLTDAA